MKKILALVLALALIFALAACGGSKGSENTITIGVYEPASGDNGAAGKQEVLGIEYANKEVPTVEIGGETYDVELVIGTYEKVGYVTECGSTHVSSVNADYGNVSIGRVKCVFACCHVGVRLVRSRCGYRKGGYQHHNGEGKKYYFRKLFHYSLPP